MSELVSLLDCSHRGSWISSEHISLTRRAGKNVFSKKARAVSCEAAHKTIISADYGQLSALSQSWPDPQVQICIKKDIPSKVTEYQKQRGLCLLFQWTDRIEECRHKKDYEWVNARRNHLLKLISQAPLNTKWQDIKYVLFMKCLCAPKRVSSAVNYSAIHSEKIISNGKWKQGQTEKRAVSFFHGIFKWHWWEWES